MTEHIEAYLQSQQRRIARMRPPPILLRWLTLPGMDQALQVIDKQVESLLARSEQGGRRKLKQWFLADDKDFVTITAERYILNYLCAKNSNLVDVLTAKGVDARLDLPEGPVGIEITTLNSSLPEWMVIERLGQLLDEAGVRRNQGYDITWPLMRAIQAWEQRELDELLAQVASLVEMEDFDHLEHETGFRVEADSACPGTIFWHVDDKSQYPWYDYLTIDLFGKLNAPAKQRQFAEFGRNIVFVGANHAAPTNWAVPGIFAALTDPNKPQRLSADALCNYWKQKLPHLSNVIGLCFFVVDINQEGPFYPLTIIWRDPADTVPILL